LSSVFNTAGHRCSASYVSSAQPETHEWLNKICAPIHECEDYLDDISPAGSS
jgi:hypothetical protein